MGPSRHSGPVPDAWKAARHLTRRLRRLWPLVRFLTGSKRLERERVDIWYSPSIPEPFDVDQLCGLWETAEDELAAWFGFAMVKPVTLLVLATDAELRRVFGDDSRGGVFLWPNAVALSVGAPQMARATLRPFGTNLCTCSQQNGAQ
jgi:hypothetical protein